MKLYLVTPEDLTMPGSWFYWANTAEEALEEHYKLYSREEEICQAEPVWVNNEDKSLRGFVVKES